jgi:hypothetical protein
LEIFVDAITQWGGYVLASCLLLILILREKSWRRKLCEPFLLPVYLYEKRAKKDARRKGDLNVYRAYVEVRNKGTGYGEASSPESDKLRELLLEVHPQDNVLGAAEWRRLSGYPNSESEIFMLRRRYFMPKAAGQAG